MLLSPTVLQQSDRYSTSQITGVCNQKNQCQSIGTMTGGLSHNQICLFEFKKALDKIRNSLIFKLSGQNPGLDGPIYFINHSDKPKVTLITKKV